MVSKRNSVSSDPTVSRTRKLTRASSGHAKRGREARAPGLGSTAIQLNIPRHALEHCINVPTGGAILLEAPAGYGKSFLLHQWALLSRRARQTVCWVVADDDDRDSDVLARKIRFALEAAGVRKLPQPKVAKRLKNGPDARDALWTALIHQIQAHPRRVLLLLDNYQILAAHSANELVAHFFRQIPNNLLLAVASRSFCQLPLSALLMQGRLQRIDKDALLFSKNELREFFGRALSSTQINDLMSATEGWPAALQIAQVCMATGLSRVSTLSGAVEFWRLIDDYFSNEVLRGTSRSSAALLVECSIASILLPDLCDAIRQRKDSADALADLASRETFLTPIDVNRFGWQLPRLLQQVLLRQASRHGADSLANAHLRAAGYFELRQQLKEALTHFVQAGHERRAAETLERESPMVVAVTKGDAYAAELLSLLPLSEIRAFPRLALCQAYLNFKRGLTDEARIQLSEVAHQTSDFSLDRVGGDVAKLQAESLAVYLAMDLYERSQAPLEYLRSLELKLPLVSKGDFRFAMNLRFALGILYKMRGDLEVAQNQFIYVDQINSAEHSPWASMWLKYHFGSLSLARGQLYDANHYLQAGIRICDTHFQGHAALPAIVKVALAEIDYERDALRDAQTKLDEGLFTVEHVEAWFEIYAALYDTSAMLHWHAGRFDALEMLLVRAVATPRIGAPLNNFISALRLRFALLQNRPETARLLIEERNLLSSWSQGAFQDVFSYREWDLLGLCLSRYEFARNNVLSGSEILDTLENVASRFGRVRTVCKAAALKSIGAYQQSNHELAYTTICQALELGYAQGYRRVFLDEGAAIVPLLELVRDKGAAPSHISAYALSLLSHLQQRAAVDGDSPLSAREKEVLLELGEGRSNKLIARKLEISAATVNFHVRNLFRKLGVRKRASAIAEAFRRGWIP